MPQKQSDKRETATDPEQLLSDLLELNQNEDSSTSNHPQQPRLKVAMNVIRNITANFTRLRSNVRAPNFFTQIYQYIVHRKITTCVLILTIVALFVTTTEILKVYTYTQPGTYLQYFPQDPDYQISQIVIDVEYNPNGNDKMTVQTWFESIVTNPYGTMKMLASENLQLTEPEDMGSTIRFDSHNKDEYWYTFDKTASMHYLKQIFEGDIFGKSESDIEFNFGLYGKTSKTAPVIILVGGFSGVDISSVFPEPQERSPYGMIYKFNSINDDLQYGRFRISGINRRESQLKQLKLVLLGILTGVMTSFVASIILDIARYIEIDSRGHLNRAKDGS